MSGSAAGAWLAVALAPGPVVALAGVVLGAAAAMTPDLDHPQARAVKRLSIVGLVLCHVIRFLSKMTTGTEHRGLSHSLVFAGLLGWLAYAIADLILPPPQATYLGISVAVGVISALLGDLVTLNGLQHLLWPLGAEISVPRVLRIRTNGPFEKLIVFPAVLILTVAGIAEIGGVLSTLWAGFHHG